MGFPKKVLGITIGWQDRGVMEAERTKVASDGRTTSDVIVCSFCNTRIRIGMNQSIPFKFCPKCLRVYKDKEEK